MKKYFVFLSAALPLMLMAACGGGDKVAGKCDHGGSPGFWFMLILVVVPLFIGLIKLFRESEATSDSLISIEGQLRRLNNKLDDLEAKQGGGDKKGGKKGD